VWTESNDCVIAYNILALEGGLISALVGRFHRRLHQIKFTELYIYIYIQLYYDLFIIVNLH